MTDNKSMPPPQKKRKRSIETPAPLPLPPPLVSYSHLVPSYFPIYQHPYYLSVGPQPPASPPITKSSPVQRILPKSPSSQPPVISPGLGPTFYPSYPVQISPHIQPNNNSADQREQARKLSHSAIERRRREKINDKILQLKELIPSCADRENLHKMTILQSAIDYIIYLKQIIGDTSQLEERSWSIETQQTDILTTGLKPMDIIQSKRAIPDIQIDSSIADSIGPSEPTKDYPTLDRNMNLDHILC